MSNGQEPCINFVQDHSTQNCLTTCIKKHQFLENFFSEILVVVVVSMNSDDRFCGRLEAVLY